MRRLSESRPADPCSNRAAGMRAGRAGAAARVGGRAVLWAFVLLVFSRGLAELVRGPQRAQVSTPSQASTVAFPDEEARAFAISFARTYLSILPGRERRREQALEPFFAEGVGERAAARVPFHGPSVAVSQATVARELPVGNGRALVTVAASMNDGRTVFLSVPIARDEHGGLAVFDLPSFSAPPGAGRIDASEPVPLTGGEADAIGDVVRRFLEAYVGGAAPDSLSYYLTSQARVAPMGAGLQLASVEEIAREPDAPAGELLVSVRVREAMSRTVYPQRFRLTVVKRDRWYVAAVAGGPSA
jgi:hypothetical protein